MKRLREEKRGNTKGLAFAGRSSFFNIFLTSSLEDEPKIREKHTLSRSLLLREEG
jgi:hypothetical protein